MASRRLVLLLAGLLMMVMVGCGNDDPVGSGAFSLEIAVVDTDGRPVQGIEARLHVPIPGVFDGLAKPATAVRFDLAEPCSVRMVVTDMEGGHVATLFDDWAVAGQWRATFSGAGAQQDLLGTRLYNCTMTALHGTEILYEETILMTLYAGVDFNQRPVLGVTGPSGIVRTTDRREFPFLYDVWPQPLHDENGVQTGEFTASDAVIITLHDPGSGVRMNHEVPLLVGPNTVRLVWAPSTGTVRDGSGTAPAAFPQVADSDVPPLPFDLRQNYPNPFN